MSTDGIPTGYKALTETKVISVGIPTDGEPVIEKIAEGTLLKNMRIGLGFHWEQTLSALLPGDVRLSEDPEFRVINDLPLETYLECVVGSEMNPDAPTEFLKAHAVISRCWTLGKILGTHDHSEEGKVRQKGRLITWEDTCDHTGFHVCSDDHCQRYQGVQPLRDEVRNAIRSTAGEVLVSPHGNLIDTRFSKCCGGKTENFSSCWQDREEPCLESFEDPWCDLSSLTEDERLFVLRSVLKEYDLKNGGGYEWEAEITTAKIRENLRKILLREGVQLNFREDIASAGNVGDINISEDKSSDSAKISNTDNISNPNHIFSTDNISDPADIGNILELSLTERGSSGRGTRLKIIGRHGTIEVGKELTIRRLLSDSCLFSSNFEVEKCLINGEPGFRFKGHGWGHGVGLCQIGAARMALAGKNYREILAFYYPGSKVTTKL